MSKHVQFTFKMFEKENVKHFGGSLIKGNPRERRPISTERPMHLVMRSTLASGERSFLRKRAAITIIIEKSARKEGVRIYSLANSGNHLHLVVLPKSRRAFSAFVRTISGLIARLVLGAERGKALKLKFWDSRPFTRILKWGRDLENALKYLKQNTFEVLGFIPYVPRKKNRLSRTNDYTEAKPGKRSDTSKRQSRVSLVAISSRLCAHSSHLRASATAR